MVTAADGVAGVHPFIDEAPDAVISDLVMPRTGGASACREITRLAGAEEPVIILFASMFQGSPHEHQIAWMGAKVHVSESTSPLDIVITVEQLLQR